MGWWRNLSLIVVVCFLIGVHITIVTVLLTVIDMIRDWSVIYSVWKERNVWMVFINVYIGILVFEVDAILGEDGSLV
jgi:ABC-type nickel/cobalt efflux system permease component RcnA